MLTFRFGLDRVRRRSIVRVTGRLWYAMVSSQARSDSPAFNSFSCIERDGGEDDEQDHREGAGVAELALG